MQKNNSNRSCSCKNILNALSSMSDEHLPQPYSAPFRTGTSNPQAACSPAWLTRQLPCAIMAVPPHLSSSRRTPGAQQQPTVGTQLALCWLTSGHGGRQRRAGLTQVTANNHLHFDTQAKHGALISEECAAMLPGLVKEFDDRFQDCKKNYVYASSWYKNTLPADFQMERIEFQSKMWSRLFTRLS